MYTKINLPGASPSVRAVVDEACCHMHLLAYALIASERHQQHNARKAPIAAMGKRVMAFLSHRLQDPLILGFDTNLR